MDSVILASLPPCSGEKDVHGILSTSRPHGHPVALCSPCPQGALGFCQTLTQFGILSSSKPLQWLYLLPPVPPTLPQWLQNPVHPLSQCHVPARPSHHPAVLQPSWVLEVLTGGVCCPHLTHSGMSSVTAGAWSFMFTLPPGPRTALGTQQVLNKG